MSIRGCRRAGALLALGASVFALSVQAQLPPIGSADVAIADPEIPPPPGDPCVVPLFDEFTFIGFDAQSFDFTPPDACPGPWQKVVLRADFDVTAGRQFDRTAKIWLGGANIYFGTTQEPSASVSPTWHIERDLTDYSALFGQPQAGRVDLDNVVDGTYTGIIHGSASLAFYPPVSTVPDHPLRPDVVVPLAADASGGTVDLASNEDHLEINFTPPRNIRRAFLDVVVQAQSSDEFWYLCVPDDVAEQLQSCPGSGFREAQVTIDGLYVGIASIYPWIYTGGIDPGLWRPSPGIQTLSFEPYRVDLTPYAAWLSSGHMHNVAVRVFNAQSYFSATANLLLYLDHGADTVDGEVTMNTLAGAAPEGSASIQTGPAGLNGLALITSTRDFQISGYVDTSEGRVITDIVQHIYFYNSQIFDIYQDQYRQRLDTRTQIDTTTTVNTGVYSHVVAEHHDWPLKIDYAFNTTAGGFEQVTSVDQGRKRWIDVGIDGYQARGAQVEQHMTTADTLLLDADGNVTGRVDQSSQQSYVYTDPFGACYSRTIGTEAGVLASVEDGVGCRDGTNALSWFDIFHNYGSRVFGATVQILP
jgi:hypothetical protein